MLFLMVFSDAGDNFGSFISCHQKILFFHFFATAFYPYGPFLEKSEKLGFLENLRSKCFQGGASTSNINQNIILTRNSDAAGR